MFQSSLHNLLEVSILIGLLLSLSVSSCLGIVHLGDREQVTGSLIKRLTISSSQILLLANQTSMSAVHNLRKFGIIFPILCIATLPFLKEINKFMQVKVFHVIIDEYLSPGNGKYLPEEIPTFSHPQNKMWLRFSILAHAIRRKFSSS